jgi:hypothetical protein
MEMPSNDLIHMLMNNHSWYRIETADDYLRAILWCLANLVTSVSYFLIPNEIKYWRKSLPFDATALISNLFIGFIAFCGLSHLAMIIIMPTGPWWAVVLIYVPMATVSAATVVVVRMNRKLILAVLDAVALALRTTPS